MNPLQNHASPNAGASSSKYSNCMHATASIVQPIYGNFEQCPVIISGPEFHTDYTYFLVH